MPNSPLETQTEKANNNLETDDLGNKFNALEKEKRELREKRSAIIDQINKSYDEVRTMEEEENRISQEQDKIIDELGNKINSEKNTESNDIPPAAESEKQNASSDNSPDDFPKDTQGVNDSSLKKEGKSTNKVVAPDGTVHDSMEAAQSYWREK